MCFIVAISGCGGGGGGDDDSGSSPPPVGPDSSISTEQQLNPSGGSVTLKDHISVEVKSGFLSKASNVRLSAVSSEETRSRFFHATDIFELEPAREELSIEVDALPSEQTSVQVDLDVPIGVSDPAVLIFRQDESSDSDNAESHAYFEEIPSIYDPGTRKVRTEVEGRDFLDRSGGRSVARLSVVSRSRATAQSTSRATAQAANAAPIPQCTMNNQTRLMPIVKTFGPTGYYFAAGTFGEPRASGSTDAAKAAFERSLDEADPIEARKGNGHAGWDLTVNKGTPLIAPEDGKIIKIKRGDYNCPDKNHSEPYPSPGQLGIYSVVFQGAKGQFAFRHLEYKSVRKALARLGKDPGENADLCWIGSISVKKGQQIGQTGDTGTSPPAAHLHIEWAPSGDIDAAKGINRRNPVCVFGNLSIREPYRDRIGELQKSWLEPTLTLLSPDMPDDDRPTLLGIKRNPDVNTVFHFEELETTQVMKGGYYVDKYLSPPPAGQRFPYRYQRGLGAISFELNNPSHVLNYSPTALTFSLGNHGETPVQFTSAWSYYSYILDPCITRTIDTFLTLKTFWTADRSEVVEVLPKRFIRKRVHPLTNGGCTYDQSYG